MNKAEMEFMKELIREVIREELKGEQLNMEQAADYLEVSVSYLYKLTTGRTIKIPFSLVGREKRFKREDLRRFKESRTRISTEQAQRAVELQSLVG